MSESNYEVEARYNVRLSMRDGVELSANVWLPVARTAGEKFPVILEMIPYRKDDWRYLTDHKRGAYFAQRGFAFCRLDVRGTGSSQGIALDEYTRDETQDGYDAVEWLAAQPWCNGRVGMWGVSYGGFAAIQVAMLQPPHLKAIVPVYATNDRYTDDVHYIGGCMVASEFAQYAVSQIGMNAMPPRLEYAGARWAEEWKTRLEKTPPWLVEWLRHPTDGPNLDYLHEIARFCDYWLKGIDNGVMDEPPSSYSSCPPTMSRSPRLVSLQLHPGLTPCPLETAYSLP